MESWFLLLLSILLRDIVLVAGKHVRHEMTLTWELGAPNGQVREMIKMNGQFPGPTFVWDEDDDVEVIVHNRMPFNNTVHWHGLMMQGTPWSDGAPGLSQKPIEMDQSFIYRFKASPAGTHWYHAHSRATLLDGLYGSIFIRPKPTAPAPWELISSDEKEIQAMRKAALDPSLMLVSDWSQFKSWEYMNAMDESRLSMFCVDSILINGKGSVYCPGEDYLVQHTSTYMKYALYPGHVSDKGCFPFMKSTEGKYLSDGRPEKVPLHLQKGCIPSKGDETVVEVDPDANGWVSLNFIAATTMKTAMFAVAGHRMWVYEVDGHYVEPHLVDTVKMYAGERYAVLVKLDQQPGDYTIHVPDSGLTQVISAYATLRYKTSGRDRERPRIESALTYGGQNTSELVTLNRDHLPPYPPLTPAPKADVHHVLYTHRWHSPWQYTISGGGMYAEDRSAYAPLLYDTEQPDALNESLVIRTRNGSWVDLVLQVGSLPDQPQEFPHFIHKHTGKTWQVGAGEGIWNYSSVDEAAAAEPSSFNFKNPNYRDTFVTSFDGPSWIVLRYQVVNPGPWLFHCHIETHLAGGMAVVILDGIDAWPEIPPEYAVDAYGFFPGQERPAQFLDGLQAGQSANSWNTLVHKMIDFLQTTIS
ncbi:conidial pigment biosynthesis oxidase Arb2/brown2 [Talaromyces proteolyticus]|uniref:Conidial pigment biosynthesis oxidase Arb2/brown2 n=1 Tax=Talaromyces proteolyticus TaxID=1131652 RepID=A0AAD4PUJ1_9EURO|nr:conidial pigment biosynthesis oxidase Arb2/brown2 [Talaromyces proteolyticus]KAH8695156.1 conidial pigment biosynthesis oxidase Arb2/brown2 [Talaromyces proteolyticus]